MQIWQLHEAKAKLTQLMNEAKHEPQIISRHGVSENVLISLAKYRELCRVQEDIVSFFKNSPLDGVDINLNRDSALIREVDL